MCASTATQQTELNGLLRQSGGGDQKAFAELYKRTSSKLFGTCLSMLRDRSDAQEVLQDIYVAIWHQASGFDESRATAMTWMLAVSRNKAIDRLRGRVRNLPAWRLVPEQAADVRFSPVARAEAHQEAHHLASCLSKLKPHHEQSLRDAFFSGETYRELAVRRQMPEGTMKCQIRRSLMQLRISLVRMEALPIELA